MIMYVAITVYQYDDHSTTSAPANQLNVRWRDVYLSVPYVNKGLNVGMHFSFENK